MRRFRPVVAASALVIATLATGCGAVVSTVFTEVGQAVPELPPACENAIGDFLVRIEPIVRNVNWDTATEEQISSLGAAMAPATQDFDPEACPELDTEQSRLAWQAIAARRAPATAEYIDYTYSSD